MNAFICTNCGTEIEGREEDDRIVPPGSCWKCGSVEIIENDQEKE